MHAAISPPDLKARLGEFPPPTLVDVRAQDAFERDRGVIAGALRRDPEAVDAWASALDPWRAVVVYCAHGAERSRRAVEALERRGLAAQCLEGGLDGWRAAGGATVPFKAPTRWVTRERPKIDRIACPWLVRRFIDPSAELFYVPASEVLDFARAREAEPYDVAGVRYTHAGAECSFDAFIRIHALADPALSALATIVRAADTDALALAAEAPGLLAVSQGLSRLFADDHAMLQWGCLVYDALYVRCRDRLAAGARSGAMA